MSILAPLTFQQRWLWSLMQAHPDWSCTVTDNFRLTGPLQIPLLERALDEVRLRHSCLRMRVVSAAGAAQAEIMSHQPNLLGSTRIVGRCATEIETNARRAVESVFDLEIDPTIEPPLRARLLELSDEEHWLVLSMHRLVGDCSSIGQVFREGLGVYDRLARNQPLDEATPVPQYTDYALWQQRTHDDWAKRHEPYWKERLAGAVALQCPAQRDRGQVGEVAIGRMDCHFGEILSTQVRELARGIKTLPGTVMLAAYAAVLSKWCNQNHFIVPFLVTGRSSEYRRTLGNFSYPLYLRLELTGKETFQELVTRVGNEFYRALAHQDSGRVATQHPELLAGTVFQWITWHPDDALNAAEVSVPGTRALTAERLPVRDFAGGLTAVPPGQVDVEITLFDTAKGIYAAGAYPAGRFEAQTLQRLMDDVRSTTEGFVRPHSSYAHNKPEIASRLRSSEVSQLR